MDQAARPALRSGPGGAADAGPGLARTGLAGDVNGPVSRWLTHDSDGTTSLSSAVSDQAQLHGLLIKVRDLGVTLISVEATDPSGDV